MARLTSSAPDEMHNNHNIFIQLVQCSKIIKKVFKLVYIIF